ncbi:MAG: hypothetical protein HOY79_21910 [Streptomyces sp.]|nr:hypothetical protein [Streptomyces sp.]
MATRTLPHDPYITAVCDALTTAGLAPGDDMWTSDSETRGTYCYLTAVITLDPDHAAGLDDDDIPEGAQWPHGLILIWEWHTGIEADQGEPERGPQWLFAEAKKGGSNEYPTTLPVHGYASPAAVVDAVRKVITGEIKPGDFYNSGQPRGWTGGLIGDSWDRSGELDAACEAWGNDESQTA